MKKDLTKVKTAKTKTGKEPTVINCKPKLAETVVFVYSKMNPPTNNHSSLIEEMDFYDGDKIVHLSKDVVSSRSPLTYEQKLFLSQTAYGDIVEDTDTNGLVESMINLASRYENLVILVGESEEAQIQEFLEANDFGFENFTVLTYGRENPDFSSYNGVSAKALKEAFVNLDIDIILQSIPESIHPYIEDISECFINESLNVSQRIHRGQVMKRNSAKLKTGRKIIMARHADKKRLEKRSTKDAIGLMKQRFTGGAKVADLGYGDKARVEDMMKTRKGAIKRLSARLLNKVRKREADRHQHKNKNTGD